ncbi:MAG: DUF4252 domain-containing protein [Saprospiraceae bacterium]
MKKLALLTTLLLMAVGAQAQAFGLHWKYKDYEGAIPVTAPGWLINIVSWLPEEKESRRLIRKVRKVKVLAFVDGAPNPISERDMRRFHRKAQKRGLEEIMFVRDSETRVQVYGREKRGQLRNLFFFVHSEEETILVAIKTRLQFDDIVKSIEVGQVQFKDYPSKKKERAGRKASNFSL